jgi:hypothetical protein
MATKPKKTVKETIAKKPEEGMPELAGATAAKTSSGPNFDDAMKILDEYYEGTPPIKSSGLSCGCGECAEPSDETGSKSVAETAKPKKKRTSGK